jgi:hypothetical protein
MLPLALFTSTRAGEADTFGSGVSLSEATPIATLLERPSAFDGRTVRVEGVVTSVCTEMGCWMALAASDKPTGPTMLIQVEHDGAIVFPVSAKGHRAAAQGQLERVGGSAEGREAAAELAAQQGGAKQSSPTEWRIKATGAVIY